MIVINFTIDELLSLQNFISDMPDDSQIKASALEKLGLHDLFVKRKLQEQHEEWRKRSKNPDCICNKKGTFAVVSMKPNDETWNCPIHGGVTVGYYKEMIAGILGQGAKIQFLTTLHKETLALLKQPDGNYRMPSHDEWAEDYGMAFVDKMRKERDAAGLAYMNIHDYIKMKDEHEQKQA